MQKSSSHSILKPKPNFALRLMSQREPSITNTDKSHRRHESSHLRHERSHSLLLNNKLTKSYYSICDTSLHSATLKVPTQIGKSNSKIMTVHKSKILERYQSQQTEEPIQKYYSVTQTVIPKLNFRRSNERLRTVIENKEISRQAKSQENKFKLLFKEANKRKTNSERKIDRINWKINSLERHKKLISLMKPKPTETPEEVKVEPRGTIIEKDRIQKLARSIRMNIELYFNMYTHPKKVGDLLRAVQGYTPAVHEILFESRLCAKRIMKDEEITGFFWIFKPQQERPTFYGEEDLQRFNVLQNFSMKMDKNFKETKKNFVQFQSLAVEKTKAQIASKLSVYQNNQALHPEIASINQFIQNKKRHNQEARESSLSKLEELGVRFNVEQRSKDLIVREKERIMSGLYGI